MIFIIGPVPTICYSMIQDLGILITVLQSCENIYINPNNNEIDNYIYMIQLKILESEPMKI